MTHKVSCTVLALMVIVYPSSSSAVTLLYDDFETYADTTEMNAAWSEGTTGAGTLDTTLGDPSQSMFHPAGTTNKRAFTDTIPDDLDPIVWEFDFFDDGSDLETDPPAPNKRLTSGLRTDAGGVSLESILEMGRYNNLVVPEGGPNISGYGIRTVFIAGDPANWIAFVDEFGEPIPVEAGWHHFRATIGFSQIEFEVDLQKDGTIDSTRIITTADGGHPYNVVRLGGPSDLSSAGGSGNFDNVIIRTGFVPRLVIGDMDVDGDTDFDDIDDFVLGLQMPSQYESNSGLPPRALGDTDQDADQDFDDIPGFVGILTSPPAQGVPEPSTAGLAVLAILALATLWMRRV